MISPGTSKFNRAIGVNQRRVDSPASKRKILDSALSIDAIERIGRHAARPKKVVFCPIIHGMRATFIFASRRSRCLTLARRFAGRSNLPRRAYFLSLAELQKQTVEVIPAFSGDFATGCTNIRHHTLVSFRSLHFSAPRISISGVSKIGLIRPNRRFMACKCRILLIFARCRQFQVNKYSILCTDATARWGQHELTNQPVNQSTLSEIQVSVLRLPYPFQPADQFLFLRAVLDLGQFLF